MKSEAASTAGSDQPLHQRRLPREAAMGLNPCCNPDCDRPGTVYVGDLTTLGNYACSLCEVYIVGDGNDD